MSGGPCMIRYTPTACSSVWGRPRKGTSNIMHCAQNVPSVLLARLSSWLYARHPTHHHTHLLYSLFPSSPPILHSPTPGAERAHGWREARGPRNMRMTWPTPCSTTARVVCAVGARWAWGGRGGRVGRGARGGGRGGAVGGAVVEVGDGVRRRVEAAVGGAMGGGRGGWGGGRWLRGQGALNGGVGCCVVVWGEE